MPLDSHPASPLEPVNYGDGRLHQNWSEHTITAIAISIAMLIVAVIAVLMGMA